MDLTATQRQHIQLRVDEGARLLDRERPTWHVDLRQSIDGDSPLDMAHCEQCVLGKLEGDYDEAMTTLFPKLSGPEQEEKAIELGFTLPGYLRNSPDPFLTHDAWRYLGWCWLAKL